MWMVVRIPAGDITNLHYNFVVAEPLLVFKANENVNEKQLQIVLKTKLLACYYKSQFATMIQTLTPLLVATFLTQILKF